MEATTVKSLPRNPKEGIRDGVGQVPGVYVCRKHMLIVSLPSFVPSVFVQEEKRTVLTVPQRASGVRCVMPLSWDPSTIARVRGPQSVVVV